MSYSVTACSGGGYQCLTQLRLVVGVDISDVLLVVGVGISDLLLIFGVGISDFLSYCL